MSENLVWIDCEMTGLDLAADALVEVAVLVTDAELNVLGEGVDILIKPTDEQLAQMGDFVRQMHITSGLLDQLASGTTMADAEARALDYIRTHAPLSRKAPLAGNTIGTDRMFLARDMPELDAHLHYRSVDVSSLKELARRWYPKVLYQAPAKSGNHRALADIQESIEELRYYREAVFVPAPGHTSAELRTMAAKHRGALTQAPQRLHPPSLQRRDQAHSRRFPTPRADALSLLSRQPWLATMVGIAQLVERRVVVADVAGSSPVTHPDTWPDPGRGSGHRHSSVDIADDRPYMGRSSAMSTGRTRTPFTANHRPTANSHSAIGNAAIPASADTWSSTPATDANAEASSSGAPTKTDQRDDPRHQPVPVQHGREQQGVDGRQQARAE